MNRADRISNRSVRFAFATLAAYGVLGVLAALPSGAAPLVSVEGNRLVDGQGAPLQLLGVNRSGTEYACSDGYGFTDSPDPAQPDSAALIEAMRTWNVRAVRIPLNEACWLGINGVENQWGGKTYRTKVATYVSRLEAAGINPILDLQVVDPGSYPASESTDGLRPLPDKNHALPFWRQVAGRFGDDRQVVFDLYNEPNDTTWRCLRDGCRITEDFFNQDVPDYRAVGTQTLVRAIRRAGAENVIMVPGINFTGDLSKWLRYRPTDPLDRIVASFHSYEAPLGECYLSCWDGVIAPIAARFPVITGEFGDTDCDHDYSDGYMGWADAHDVSYLAWTWDATAPGGWTCAGGPSLILDYEGTPTDYGVGVRDHFLGR